MKASTRRLTHRVRPALGAPWLALLLYGAMALGGSLAHATSAATPSASPSTISTGTPTATAIVPGPAPALATLTVAQATPSTVAAPPEPRPDETNAERGKTQPGNNAPFWRSVRETGQNAGITTLPGAEKGVLIQPFVQYPGSRLASAGEAWRQVRNNWILPYGGALLTVVLLAMALFYWRRGSLGGHLPDTGRTIERFTPFERSAHWLNAIAFVVLAVSGLVMAFGKYLLLPVLGATLFGWLTYVLKTVHNFAGPLFAVTLVVVIVTFARDNLPKAYDITWLKRGGGLFGDHEVPSHRFNAGEKGLFWVSVLGLGAVVVVTGLVLDQVIPGLAYLRTDMQVAHLLHASASIGMMAIMAGHIYMGTIGMKGAYAAMRTGHVDEAWAREHHELWYDDIKAGRIPAQRSTPARAVPGPMSPAR
jgi:formate dehydrogenase subunit gamma